MTDELRDFERDAGPGTPKDGDDAKETSADLMQMPESRAAKLIVKWWTGQREVMRPRFGHWRANRARRKGVSGVQVVKDRDTKDIVVWVPPGPQMPSMNKADRLCRRLAATVYADPPKPEATPSRDEDEARAQAEFATRVLEDLDSEGKLDGPLTARQAFDIASTYDSGFRHYVIDPTGNGKRKVEIIANAQVRTVEAALEDPGELPHVKRLVVEETGELVDEIPEGMNARYQWLPRIKSEVLTGKHVRFLPHTASDIWKAQGALIGAMTPLSELRTILPAINNLPEDKMKELLSWKPQDWKELMPAGQHKYEGGDKINEDQLVCTITCYYMAGPRMTDGCYAIVGGEGIMLHREAWYDKENDEPLDIPLDQIKQFDDEDEPYGRGLMHLLGDSNEIRNAQVMALLEHLDRFTNRKVFVPTTSSYQPKSAQAATSTHVYINPGGEPSYEEMPPFPVAAKEMFMLVTEDMDDESSLQAPAQGQTDASVQSGLHAQQLIEQSMMGLSDVRQNAVRALIRGWRITLQLIRWRYTIPQQVSWVGEDGQHKQQMWTNADLGGTKDVRLQRGSFTAMTPSAKAAIAEHLHQLGALSLPELERIAIAQVGGQIGQQDNPHRQRIQRQILIWLSGPPQGWEPPQGPGPDGQPVPDPVMQAVFKPLPSDDVPEVAVVRMDELGRTTAGMKFERKPPEWQMGLLQEFERARQAAGIQTVAEQAEASSKDIERQDARDQADRDAKMAETKVKTEADTGQAKITSEGEITEAEIMAKAEMAPDIHINMEPGGNKAPASVTP